MPPAYIECREMAARDLLLCLSRGVGSVFYSPGPDNFQASLCLYNTRNDSPCKLCFTNHGLHVIGPLQEIQAYSDARGPHEAVLPFRGQILAACLSGDLGTQI